MNSAKVSTDPMSKQKITETYAARRDGLKVPFPQAYDFLMELERDQELWLSTATNAHVYKGDGFLAYVRIKARELSPPSLLLSGNYNHCIAEGAVDRSRKIFPAKVTKLLEVHSGGWHTRRSAGVIEITSAAPSAFFADLADVMRNAA